jgi:hypothetical protein
MPKNRSESCCSHHVASYLNCVAEEDKIREIKQLTNRNWHIAQRVSAYIYIYVYIYIYKADPVVYSLKTSGSVDDELIFEDATSSFKQHRVFVPNFALSSYTTSSKL